MVKVTRFVGTEPVESERHERLTSEIVEQAARHADVAIFSSVGNDTDEALALLNRHFRRVYNLTEQLPLPIAVDYDRARLGNDRIASAVGAHDAFPGRNILVVDAGTAITLDLVDANGTFRGGNIALGIRSRLRALHDYTSRLPLVDLEGDTPLIGKTTDEAIALLDKYLDDAYIAHLPSVRIVHGKGTGALRNAVHAHLRRQKIVKDFHLGEFGEGDAGVTIAEFK